MSPEPLYQRIAADLRRRIREGEFALGSKLPGRGLLAKEYGIALPTIERAMGQLLATGEVEAQRRKGTVVARLSVEAPPAAQPRSAARGLRMGLIAPAWPDDTRADALRDPRVAAIVDGIERALADGGGELTFRNIANLARTTPDHIAAARAGAAALLAEGAEAICLLNPYANDDLEGAARDLAASLACPLCYGSTRALRLAGAQVRLDLDHGGELALRHLHERGYRRVLYLAPWREEWIEARERIAKAASSADAEWRTVASDRPPVYDREGQDPASDAALDQARVEIPDLFTADEPWAVLCPNAGIALRVLAAADAAGARIGPELGVVALDDDATAFARGLTACVPPLAEFGAALVHAAAAGAGSRSLRPRLVARASTRR